MKYLILISTLLISIFHLGQRWMQLPSESHPNLYLRHRIRETAKMQEQQQKYMSYLGENRKLPEPAAATSTITATSTPDEKEGKHAVNLNKTPPQRQRRKKHRPKVIVEGKPKKTPKSTGSNPSRGKRVRKNERRKSSMTQPIEVTSDSSDWEQEVLEPRGKSCRKALHFDSQTQTRDDCSLSRPSDSGTLKQDSPTKNINSTTGLVEERLEQVCSSIKPTWSMNQVQRLPSDYQMKNNIEQNDRVISSLEKGNTIGIVLHDDTRSFEGSPKGFNVCTNSTFTDSEQATCSKRKHSDAIKQADTGSINLTGVHYNTLYAYQSMPWIHFPNICKKKRTEKGQGHTTSSAFTSVTEARHFTRPENTYSFNDPKKNHIVSESNNFIAEPQFYTSKSKTAAIHGGKEHQDKLQTYRSIMAFGQTQGSTKKRSRATKRVFDLPPPARFAVCENQPIHPTNQPPVDSSIHIVDRSKICINALFENMNATVAKKKRTRKKFPKISALSDTNKVPWLCRFIPPNSYQFYPKTLVATSEEHGNEICCTDEIVEQFKHLGTNEEKNNLAYTEQALIPYNMHNQEHNAIVIYGKDGTIVPFSPMKKRRPRPKVELDEETNKVWKLLLHAYALLEGI